MLLALEEAFTFYFSEAEAMALPRSREGQHSFWPKYCTFLGLWLLWPVRGAVVWRWNWEVRDKCGCILLRPGFACFSCCGTFLWPQGEHKGLDLRLSYLCSFAAAQADSCPLG